MAWRRHAWIVIALAVALFFPLARCTREWRAIDACHDSGGAWLERASKCSHDPAEIDRAKTAP